MDKVRKSYFSGNWYPEIASEVQKQLQKWDSQLPPFAGNIVSGIVPHAGWYFSGIMAYDVIRRISKNTELLFILGGHLPDKYPFLYYEESYCQTPCGNLKINRKILDSLKEHLPFEIDKRPDNTIEVQLPLVRAVLGEIDIIPIRVPAGSESLLLIDHIISLISENKIPTALIGSTDLTHYGYQYDFTPADSLTDPLEWVRVSDGEIIKAMIEVKPETILELSRVHKSACSAGAAACAADFARKKGVKNGKLLKYDTSYSRHQSESFVGYGAVVYEI